MAMMSKIIEVPIADKNNAEKVVNEQLAAIGGNITSLQALDERRVIVFYNGDGSTPGTGGGGSTPGTGDDEGGSEDPGDDPGTGGGTGGGEDPGTGGGSEDPGDDPGTGGDTEEYDYPIVPLEEDPWEGKFGEYAFAVRVDWPAAVAKQALANFGELGTLMQDECDELWEKSEAEYLNWLEQVSPYELYAWQVTADVDKYPTDHYDVLIGCTSSKTQVSTAPGPFNMANGTYQWIFNHNEKLEDSSIQLTSTFGTPTSVVLIRRAVKKSS